MQAMQTTSGAAATGPETPFPLVRMYAVIRAANRARPTGRQWSTPWSRSSPGRAGDQRARLHDLVRGRCHRRHWSGWLRCLPRRQRHLRRSMAGTGLRPHTSSRRCAAADGVTSLTAMWPRRSGSGWRPPAARTSRSATIGRQLLECGLIDEIDLHIAPVLLGDGIRLFDSPGGNPPYDSSCSRR
jgi:RibD C-terminal domain